LGDAVWQNAVHAIQPASSADTASRLKFGSTSMGTLDRDRFQHKFYRSS